MLCTATSIFFIFTKDYTVTHLYTITMYRKHDDEK